VWNEDSDRRNKMAQEKKVSFRQRWNEAQPTKAVLFWSVVAAVILTMIVGFNWGGWVTGGTAQTKAYQRDDYVTDQGWATMFGDEEPDRNVADACAKLIELIDL
jgi:hypothetical protein